MRFGLVLPCHGDDGDFLTGLLQLANVDLQVVVISDLDFQGEPVKRTEVISICRQFRAIPLLVHTTDQRLMRNLGIAYLEANGIDYAILLDADTWPSKQALECLKKATESGETAYSYKQLYMFKYPNVALGCPTDGGTLVCLKTSERVIGRGEFSKVTPIEQNGEIYHFSYVGTDERIQKKLKRSSHAAEMIPDWYERVYKNFTLSSTNLHPTHPAVFSHAYKVELPTEIKTLWDSVFSLPEI